MDKYPNSKQSRLFLRLFSPRITVHITNDSVSLDSNRRSMQLGAYICFRKKRDKYEIASVGEMPKDNIRSEKVELFHSESRSDKFECLVAFMKHGLSSVSSRFALVRPTVICRGAENLGSFFGGYEEGILRRAFREAGAVDVYFD